MTNKTNGEWRSIETAPKDGTPVDLWCNFRLTDCRWAGSWGWSNQWWGRIVGWISWGPSAYQRIKAQAMTEARAITAGWLRAATYDPA